MFFEFNPVELILVTGIMLFGSASQAAIGMGLNLFAIPLLLMINPVYAPGPVLIASCALSFLALWRVPAEVNKQELHSALIGLAVGTVVAGVVVALVDRAFLSRLLGLFVVLGVVLALSGWSAALTSRNLRFAGTGAGFLGTIAGVHAPPIALLYQGLSPERVRGAILTFVGIGNAFSVVALVAVAQFRTEQILATLILAPGVAIGLWLAPTVAQLIGARVLRNLILGISGISGIMLMVG